MHFSAHLKNIHGQLSYECTPKRENVQWNRYNAAWPFQGDPSSDHAMPTAAMCSITEHS
jgi:hypothetical protein